MHKHYKVRNKRVYSPLIVFLLTHKLRRQDCFIQVFKNLKKKKNMVVSITKFKKLK